MPRWPRVFADGAIYDVYVRKARWGGIRTGGGGGSIPGIPFSLLRGTFPVSASRSGNGESADPRASAAGGTGQLHGRRTRGKGPAHGGI